MDHIIAADDKRERVHVWLPKTDWVLLKEEMSGPTIRISDGAFPDVSAVSESGGTNLEITDLNDFDLGLLGNQRKLVTPPRADSPVMKLGGGGGGEDIKAVDDIDFVNLEDTATSFSVKPDSGVSDTIRIRRDGPAPSMPQFDLPTVSLNPKPVIPAAAPAPPAPPTKSSGWLGGLFGGGSTPAPAPAPAAASRGWFGSGGGGDDDGAGSGGGGAPSLTLTPDQEAAKKTEGLTLLERMDRKGVGGTKMTMANTLEEINAEVARRKDSKGLEASIRFQRSMLTTVTSGMEFLNSKYDPLGVALDGWSEQVNENIEDYDEIFEELYDKYKDKSKVAPEVRLIMSLGLSAAMCHVTNTMFKSKMPDMSNILRQNPELARQMAKAAAEQAVGPGFANFVSMGMGSGGGGGGQQRQQAAPAPMPSRSSMVAEEDFGGGGGGPMMPPMGGGVGGPIPSLDPRGGMNVGATPMTARREMRGPSGMEDILEQINVGRSSAAATRSMPPPAFDADDLGSVASGLTTETMRRAGLSRRRKAAAAQPTGATLTLNV